MSKFGTFDKPTADLFKVCHDLSPLQYCKVVPEVIGGSAIICLFFHNPLDVSKVKTSLFASDDINTPCNSFNSYPFWIWSMILPAVGCAYAT